MGDNITDTMSNMTEMMNNVTDTMIDTINSTGMIISNGTDASAPVDVGVGSDDSGIEEEDVAGLELSFILFLVGTAILVLILLSCFVISLVRSRSAAKEEPAPEAVDENNDDNKRDIETPADKTNVEEVPDQIAAKSMDSGDGSKIVQQKSTEKPDEPEEIATKSIDQSQSAVSATQSKSQDNEIKDLKSESKESVKSETNDDLKSKSKDSVDQNVEKETEQPKELVAVEADLSVEVPMERVETFEVKNEALCGSLDCC